MAARLPFQLVRRWSHGRGVPIVYLCIPPNGSYSTGVTERRDTQEPGGLWRDVVNECGSETIRPALYVRLLDSVLPRWRDWTYFLGQAALMATDERAGRIAADLARA